MNKLLVITLLVGLFSFGTQGFRMPRQAEGEEGAVMEEGVPEEPAHEAPAHEEIAPEAPEAPESPEAPAPELASEVPEEPAHEIAHEVHESEEPESAGPLTYITETIRSAWDKSVETASGWIETVQGLKLEEKAKTLYDETTSAIQTYSGIVHDQVYHLIYNNNQ